MKETPSKRKQIYLSVSLASNEFTIQPTFTAQVSLNQKRESQIYDMDSFKYDLKKDFPSKKIISEETNQLPQKVKAMNQINLPQVFALDQSVDSSPQSPKSPAYFGNNSYR